MPSEIEEIVVASHGLKTEDSFPNLCNRPFGIGLERSRLRLCPLNPSGKASQGMTIHLSP